MKCISILERKTDMELKDMESYHANHREKAGTNWDILLSSSFSLQHGGGETRKYEIQSNTNNSFISK